MRAEIVEDLIVFAKARRFAEAVFETCRGFTGDQWLATQLSSSAESVVANIAEGFQQPTDRAFSRYLVIAAGSVEESRAHLASAELRGQISAERCDALSADAREITKMLRSLVAYLQRCDRKQRFTT